MGFNGFLWELLPLGKASQERGQNVLQRFIRAPISWLLHRSTAQHGVIYPWFCSRARLSLKLSRSPAVRYRWRSEAAWRGFPTPSHADGADHGGVSRARMACKPDSVTAPGEPGADDGHSSRPAVADGLRQPTRIARAEEPWAPLPEPARPLFGLAPGGACHATDVAAGAVGSYPTVSPLPAAEAAGGLFSVALSLGLPRAGVTRRHFSLESGLSSTLRPRPSGHPRARPIARERRPGQRSRCAPAQARMAATSAGPGSPSPHGRNLSRAAPSTQSQSPAGAA